MKFLFPRLNFWLLLLFILTLILFVFGLKPNAQAFDLSVLPSRTISIEVQGPDVSPTPLVPVWNFLDKLQEAKNLVASSSFNLQVGKKDIVYYEKRITLNSAGNITVSNKRLTDPEREIALVLIDLKSGDLETIKITERGNSITSPKGYDIKNVERPNGITNNAWNTCRQVVAPLNKAVVLNVWPHYVTIKVAKPIRNKKGTVIRTIYTSKEVVESVVYSPYCDDLHKPEFVENGKNYRQSISRQALELLREKSVHSRTFPDKLLADVIAEGKYLKLEYFERLPLIEHMDYGEFKLDSQKSSERVDVILGTNTNQAYNLTCSGKKACGWLQYTKSTWNDMRIKNPSAQLSIFETGVKDHVMSMVAAMLLHDNNLKAGVAKFGLKVFENNDWGEEMLAANYNGGPARPYSAYRASILDSLGDWLINPMRTETKQYIEKLRFVRENYN